MSTPSLFSSWGLSSEVMQAIETLGYQNPTPVQEAVIPFLCAENRDTIVLAKTGTGKTAAFGIPLVEKLESVPGIQALILCPTRELASQVAKNLQALGAPKRLMVTSILGGESYRRQIESLRRNPQIVVSTPGRLVDLLEQKVLDISKVKHLILDEADEMLSFGFQEPLEFIRESLDAENLKTWMFSATMSQSVRRLADRILKDPKTFSLTSSREESPKISSFAAVVYEEDKEKALSLLLRKESDFYGIIFAQTKKQVSDLEQSLLAMGMRAESLHGDKPQVERNKVLERIRRRQSQILVATDVAARGLDIQDLTHVVNFEIPWDVETYTHRIGRTARAGKTGTVWTLVRPKEAVKLRKFERALNFKFENLKIPSTKDVLASVVRRQLDELLETNLNDTQRDFFDGVIDQFATDRGMELNTETRDWLRRSLQQATGDALKGAQAAEPRTFELRSADSQAGRSGEYRDRRPSHPGVRRFNDRGGDRFRGGDRGGERGGFDRGGDRGFERRPRFGGADGGYNRVYEQSEGGGGGERPPRFRRDDRGGEPRGDRPERRDDHGGFREKRDFRSGPREFRGGGSGDNREGGRPFFRKDRGDFKPRRKEW